MIKWLNRMHNVNICMCKNQQDPIKFYIIISTEHNLNIWEHSRSDFVMLLKSMIGSL